MNRNRESIVDGEMLIIALDCQRRDMSNFDVESIRRTMIQCFN